MATTSSGRSRRPDLWYASAIALVAIALFRVAQPDPASAPEVRAPGIPIVERAPGAATADDAQADPASASPVEPISAAAVARALAVARPGTRDLVIARMLTTWVRADPQAAARYAELQTDSVLREVALRTTALEWAPIDPDSASHWAASLADETERDRVVGQVALAIADSDPQRALGLLAQRGVDPEPDAARLGVISSWASRDFAAAQSWVEAQAPGSARDDLVQHLAVQRARTDPGAAARFASRMLGADTARDAYAGIIRRWVEQDPEGARAWIEAADARTRRRVDAELDVVPPVPAD